MAHVIHASPFFYTQCQKTVLVVSSFGFIALRINFVIRTASKLPSKVQARADVGFLEEVSTDDQ